jgi:perosamine synthetase
MNAQQRKDALKRGLSTTWRMEPMLGSYYGQEEIDAIVRTVTESMDVRKGFGFICEEIEEFERAFADYIGARYCVSITSAGGGLDMAMIALDLEPEDEVIVPTINFRAALMAVLGQKAKLVLCEVDPATLNADPSDVEKRVTPRTRAILPTHMNGLSADIDALQEIAERHPHPTHGPLKVIGDAARCLGGGYKGTKVGKRGWMTVFSFHTQKCMTTLGEGGAITTDDEELFMRLQAIRQWGSIQHRGHPERQGTWWGGNYKMSKVQAAVGLVQVGRLPGLIEERRRLGHARNEMLRGCPWLQLPAEPEGYEHCYYLYPMLAPAAWAGEKRDRLIKLLGEEYHVDADVFNPPAHKAMPFLKEHTQGQHLPVSDEVGARLLSAPIHPKMPDEDNAYMAAALWEATERIAKEA